jgi:hypothetical protein
MHASDWMAAHFKTCRACAVDHFLAGRLKKKRVHENVSFCSIYNGQLQLCMSLRCDCKLVTNKIVVCIDYATPKAGNSLHYLSIFDIQCASAFFKDSSVVGQNCQRAHFPYPPPLYVITDGVSQVPQAQVS